MQNRDITSGSQQTVEQETRIEEFSNPVAQVRPDSRPAQRADNSTGLRTNIEGNYPVSQNYAALLEAARRLSEAQLEEAQNELGPLAARLEARSDQEKLEFLEYALRQFSAGTNPEILVVLEQLWWDLSKGRNVSIEASQLLLPIYAENYESQFALKHFENLLMLNAELELWEIRDGGISYYRDGQIENSILYLGEYIDIAENAGGPADKESYGVLFNAYKQSGELLRAEAVGLAIISHFNDIQHWQDMQQFYRSTGNSAGLSELEQMARSRGIMNAAGDWLN
ncbi:MAG: hypothetical protein RL120_03235 [Gammaproteobacteria bacterium]